MLSAAEPSWYPLNPSVVGQANVSAGLLSGGGMDILVMLEENPDHSPVLAHVNSVPSPLGGSSTKILPSACR